MQHATCSKVRAFPRTPGGCLLRGDTQNNTVTGIAKCNDINIGGAGDKTK